MYSQTWIMSFIALLVMDVRTGAQEQDMAARRCRQCSPSNGTACEQAQGWLTATCPSARPYCATVAAAPDFATSLGCAAATAACSLTLSTRQTLELTCICAGQLCNAPFSAQLRKELLNFSYPNANESALTEAFFKLSNFANVSESALYKTITVDATPTIMPVRNSSEVVTLSSVSAGEVTRRAETIPRAVAMMLHAAAMPRAQAMLHVEAITRPEAMPHAEAMPSAETKSRAKVMPRPEAIPRAEALKQQATVPSDDDEDESEGSGAYEDSRSHIQSHAGSAPAAPSSYLPAEGNKAVHLSPNLLLPPIILICTLA